MADVVHIRSNPYTFRLDKHAELGMITPMWDANSKAQTTHLQTQFLLELSDPDKYKTIREDLKTLDPFLLLFLRRLKQIKTRLGTSSMTITVEEEEEVEEGEEEEEEGEEEGEEEEVEEEEEEEEEGEEKEEEEEEEENNGDDASSSIRRVTLSKRNDTTRSIELQRTCLVIRKVLADLPTETRRPNVQRTEIVLAFPVTDKNLPTESCHKVYAFLPIEEHSGVKVGSSNLL